MPKEMDWDTGVDDLLDESSVSNFDDSLALPDVDAILQPLSDSQQAREADLDMIDEQITQQELNTNNILEEKSSQECNKYKKAQPVQIRRVAPGLDGFLNPPSLAYYDLNLETDFHWQGRERILGEEDFPKAALEQMLTDKDEFVKRLAPEIGHSLLISEQKEFISVVDFLFYSACSCESRLLQSILEKAFLDLIQISGFQWQLTAKHIFTSLLNLNFDKSLLSAIDDRLDVIKNLPKFYTNADKTKNINVNTRRKLLENILYLLTRVLSMESRHSFDNAEDHLQLIRLMVLLGLDKSIIDDPLISRKIKVIIGSLLDLVANENVDELLQEISENLLVTLPSQIGMIRLHSHNMVALCRLVPNSTIVGCRLRRLIAYLSIQLVLGVQQPDLPWDVGLEDLWDCFEQNRELWDNVSKFKHYDTHCIIALMDFIYNGNYSEQNIASAHHTALNKLLNLLEEYKGRVVQHDPLDLDPVTVTEAAGELLNRWRMAFNTAEHMGSLKMKIGNDVVI